MRLSIVLLSLVSIALLPGCPGSSTTDTGGLDASAIDAPGRDVPGLDVPGLDAPAADTPGGRDTPGCAPACAGRECGDDGCGGSCGTCLGTATCTAAGTCDCPSTTCGTDICGVSECGRECGRCDPGTGCFMGACTPTGMCPGTPCTDRRGNAVCEGQYGLGRCTTDPRLDARCICGGSGGDLACDACIPEPVDPVVGSACMSMDDCPAGVPCTLGLCGEPCSAADPACASGVCWVPGDISGVCLDGCSCDVPGGCEPGTVCIDSLGTTSSACVAESAAAGRTCTRGG